MNLDGCPICAESADTCPAETPEWDLVGYDEIARRLGTTAGTVRSWRNRYADFPAPFVTLKMGPVWTWTPVKRWQDLRKGVAQ